MGGKGLCYAAKSKSQTDLKGSSFFAKCTFPFHFLCLAFCSHRSEAGPRLAEDDNGVFLVTSPQSATSHRSSNARPAASKATTLSFTTSLSPTTSPSMPNDLDEPAEEDGDELFDEDDEDEVTERSVPRMVVVPMQAHRHQHTHPREAKPMISKPRAGRPRQRHEVPTVTIQG